MQTVSLTRGRPTVEPRHSESSLRLRALRLLSDRYTHRERPSVVAEFILFAVIVLTAAWPMFSLVQAMSHMR